MSTPRIIVAFVIAPIVPALFTSICLLIFNSGWEVIWGTLTLLTIGYVSEVFVGTPVYLILKAKNATNISIYLLSGMLIGLLTYAIIFLPSVVLNFQTNPTHGMLLLSNIIKASFFAAIYGLVGSFSFGIYPIRPLED